MTSPCWACRFARLCNENFTGVRTRILMKNICYAGALAALHGIDLDIIRQLLAETYAKKPQLVDSNMKAIQLGYDTPSSTSAARCRCASRRWTPRAASIIIDGNTAAALGCIYAGRHGRRLVPDHALDLADGRLQEVLAIGCASTR